jgi:catechol 2,3-dioxygenase-like lactoylglutathione lyase family enzyme
VFDHVTIRVADRGASERFYECVLSPLGIEMTDNRPQYAEWDDFSLAQATAERPVTRRLHIGFGAPSPAQVEDFWRVGRAAGYRDDGRPGPRPEYTPDYYGGFLLDPDGNSAEAVHHGSVRTDGAIDHLWIRVRDVAASKRFYETAGVHGGFRLGSESATRVQFRGASGSFSVVAGEEPTENAHLAFGADNDATVRRFHTALVDAGYRDDGPPGERAVYHPGYYGAYMLDPDGNNIEVVHHNR